MRRQWQPGAIVADDYDKDHNDIALGESGACHKKNVSPTGGNLFTPAITAPAAPSVPAGQHPGINGVP